MSEDVIICPCGCDLFKEVEINQGVHRLLNLTRPSQCIQRAYARPFRYTGHQRFLYFCVRCGKGLKDE